MKLLRPPKIKMYNSPFFLCSIIYSFTPCKINLEMIRFSNKQETIKNWGGWEGGVSSLSKHVKLWKDQMSELNE